MTYEIRRSVEKKVYECMNDNTTQEGSKDEILYHFEKFEEHFENEETEEAEKYLEATKELLSKVGY